VKTLPLLNWCEQELQRIPPELIEAEWLAQAESVGLWPGDRNWRVKRFRDEFGAPALLLVTSPVLALGGLLI